MLQYPKLMATAATAILLATLPRTAHAGTIPDLAPLQVHLTEACATGAVSGVVTVVHHGTPIFQHVCGQADPVNGIANSLDTRFKIFSTSKYLTAIAIMRLTEQGVLELDAPLSRYVPQTPASWSGVTLRHLLNHTSGLPDLTEPMLERFNTDQPTAIRATLTTLTPEQLAPLEAAGTHHRYNNFGFELLAHAAAQASDQPFADILQSLIFDPAGMTTASVEAPNMVLGHPVAVQEDGLAIGFNGSAQKLQQAENWAFVQLGAGAVRASLADMVALDRALESNTLISAESKALMRSSPVLNRNGQTVVAERGYGLGVVISTAGGQTLVGHSGGTNGYIADFEQLPEHNATLIVLTNRGFTALGPIRQLFGEAFTAL